ncbi:archaellar assembly protein FlaJ [Halanaeroarchaeum sulfurireducens]|uniref:Flagella-related protein J n=1 Tax=Halanaeroarchaeum sulfurireducens TaxID=1604004 RepID=A0A0F7P9L9_9EURY|nr:archaellar assembly protein FlaJ [Halanaeroarchaeum sulfurireducens]AKH97831.1 flagella-related protein J [Halanaeroarchaeum sulfurireducens]ALG82225.1 flagella-related protein J [Halanaeroarchaeum sulfurireducens]
MATESDASSQDSSGSLDFSTTVASIRDAYFQMEMSVSRYFLLILAPSVIVFALSLIAVFILELPIIARLPMPLLGLLIFVTAVIYPKLQQDQRRKRMGEVFHLYVTHMTVLSTTNIDRVEVFRRIANEEEYGPLSEETRRIVQLVDTWNQSLDDACRMRAKKVPSDSVSDFFDRLAYTINAGESLSNYLVSEQEAIIRHYSTIYEGQLENLEVMKDLYMSMILSVTFALVFATVLPILSGTNPSATVAAVVAMYTFIQLGFLYAIYTVAPSDPIWYFPHGYTTTVERKLQIATAAGFALAIVAIVVTIAVMVGMTGIDPQSVPLPLYAAFPTTPLLIPGIVARGEEANVKDRDDEFVSFIRALGSSETAQQTTTTRVLARLRNKDFGALTQNIDDLYKRLNIRLSGTEAWRFFTAEAHSYLIQKFSEMYLIGREMGGDPKHLGELISHNMSEVLQLRERRDQAATTLIGVVYGISAAATFAFFIGLGIVQVLSGMTMGLETSASFDPGTLINTKVYDIGVIEYLLTLTVLVNAMLSSIIIRIVDGGHKVNSYMHFVVLTWITAIIGSMTLELVGMLLAV